MYMLTCPHCNTSNPDYVTYCFGCGTALSEDSLEYIIAKPPTRFKQFVKNDAPKNLHTLLTINLIVCCVLLAVGFAITSLERWYTLADIIAMALTVLVMYLVKSRACAVILLIYSVLASVYGLFVYSCFAPIPVIIAGILSTVTFLLLNKAYKKYKATTF